MTSGSLVRVQLGELKPVVNTTGSSVRETNAEDPPVPIPNTEVKLCRADNTCMATCREDRYSRTLHHSFCGAFLLQNIRTN